MARAAPSFPNAAFGMLRHARHGKRRHRRFGLANMETGPNSEPARPRSRTYRPSADIRERQPFQHEWRGIRQHGHRRQQRRGVEPIEHAEPQRALRRRTGGRRPKQLLSNRCEQLAHFRCGIHLPRADFYCIARPLRTRAVGSLESKTRVDGEIARQDIGRIGIAKRFAEFGSPLRERLPHVAFVIAFRYERHHGGVREPSARRLDAHHRVSQLLDAVGAQP